MSRLAMLIINAQLKIPLREFQFTFSRSSGPGGQNVNKLNTKALLRWRVMESTSLPEAVRRRLLAKHGRRLNSDGEFQIVSQRFRDAGRNVADCLEKLRQMLADAAVAPRRRKRTKPTRASVERRLDQKRRTSRRKQQRKPNLDD